MVVALLLLGFKLLLARHLETAIFQILFQVVWYFNFRDVMYSNVILCHPESARNPSLIHAVLVK